MSKIVNDPEFITDPVEDTEEVINDNLVINFAELNLEDIKIFNTEKQLYHNFPGYRVKRVFTSASEEVPAFYVAYKENKADSPYAVCMLSAYVTTTDSEDLVEEVGEWTPDGGQPEPPTPPTPTVKYTITIIIQPEDYGTVTGGGEYDEGAEVVLTAIPKAGTSNVFKYWEYGEEEEDWNNPKTIIVTGNATYVANFDTGK